MPSPGKKETEKDFINRCIPIVLKEGTAKDEKQASAICYSMWEDSKKETKQSIDNDITIINTLNNSITSRDNKKRTTTFVLSNEDVNMQGQKIMVNGWNIPDYNVPVLINHNEDFKNVAGKWVKIWKDTKNKRYMGTMQWIEEGVNPDVDLAYYLYDNDILNSVSVRAKADVSKIQYGREEREPRVTYNGQMLIETSLVTLPANIKAIKQSLMDQECIKNALQLGIIEEDLLDRIENQYKKPEIINTDINTDINIEQNINIEKEIDNKDIKDYMDKDTQTILINSIEDPYKELFEVVNLLVDEHNSKDVGYIANKVLEEIQNSKDSDEDPDQDLDDLLNQLLN